MDVRKGCCTCYVNSGWGEEARGKSIALNPTMLNELGNRVNTRLKRSTINGTDDLLHPACVGRVTVDPRIH